MRTLEDENRRLKKLLAESILDVTGLKDLQGQIDIQHSQIRAAVRWTKPVK